MRGHKQHQFTPRKLRRGAVDSSGPLDQTKGIAFRRCKRISDQFIHKKASQLEGNKNYIRYCEVTVDGKGFRR